MCRIAIEVTSGMGMVTESLALFIIASPIRILNPSLYAISANDRWNFLVVQFIRDIPWIMRSGRCAARVLFPPFRTVYAR